MVALEDVSDDDLRSIRDSYKKLDRVKRASPLFREQLERFAPHEAANMDSRGMAFRSLHLQGRTLGLLLP